MTSIEGNQPKDPFFRDPYFGIVALAGLSVLIVVTISIVTGHGIEGLLLLLFVCAMAGAAALIVLGMERKRRSLVVLGIMIAIGIELFTTLVYPIGNRQPFKVYVEIAMLSGCFWMLHQVRAWIARR